MNTIRVVIKEPRKPPISKEISNNLAGMQAVVEGGIELVTRVRKGGGSFDLYCHGEGKLVGLEPNIQFYNDVVVGTVLMSKTNDMGEAVTMSDDECAHAIVFLSLLEI